MGNVPQFVLWPNLQGEFWGAAVYVPPGVWLKDICKQWHKNASQAAGSTLWLSFRTVVFLTLTTNCDNAEVRKMQKKYALIGATHRGCHTPAISGAHVWAEWLHHPCLLGGPYTGTKSELAT